VTVRVPYLNVIDMFIMWHLLLLRFAGTNGLTFPNMTGVYQFSMTASMDGRALTTFSDCHCKYQVTESGHSEDRAVCKFCLLPDVSTFAFAVWQDFLHSILCFT
jgi:hypothetical protein